jgi:hypothetical protein
LPIDCLELAKFIGTTSVSATTLRPLSADDVVPTVTMTRATREKIRRAQESLGHTVAPDAIADVLDRALDSKTRLTAHAGSVPMKTGSPP